jgi:hypothetical protein
MKEYDNFGDDDSYVEENGTIANYFVERKLVYILNGYRYNYETTWKQQASSLKFLSQ